MKIMRSALSQAQGMGAAKMGSGHWTAQRLTAVALLPLALYFVFSVLLLEGASQADMLRYMGEPWNGVLFLALVIALFNHLQLGLQVVIEDYIRSEGKRLAVMLTMRAAVVFFGLLAFISVLKLTF